MKKMIVMIGICIFLVTGCVQKESLQSRTVKDSPSTIYNMTLKRDILCLMMAYPDHITNVKGKTEGNVYLIMKSGNTILYDDKRAKGLDEKLYNGDLQDMMEQIYPLSPIHHLMNENFDPGRTRIYPLLREVYGSSKIEVESNLKNVNIGYQHYSFNGNNGASHALESAMKEVAVLMKNKKEIPSFVFPINGTFNYRFIAGTNQLSPHSFGIAIDFVRDKRDYWKWASRQEGEKRLMEYPSELVKIFEKNGFVWGGKWGHFDILHFEYRPEIILKAKYFKKKPILGKPWYDGAPKNPRIKKYIQMIDKGIQ